MNLRFWIGLLVLVNVADVATTGYLMRFGGAELNPVAALSMLFNGILGLVLLKLFIVSFLTFICVKLARTGRMAGFYSSTAIIGLAVLYNLIQIVQIQKDLLKHAGGGLI